jgi:urea transport system permease protein
MGHGSQIVAQEAAGPLGQSAVAAVAALADADDQKRIDAIRTLVGAQQPQADLVLAALEEGNLYRRRTDDRVVIATRDGRQFNLVAAATGEVLPPETRRGVRRIAINNALRAELRALRASARLTAPEAAVRLAAVQEMMTNPTPGIRDNLVQRLAAESDVRVRSALATAVSIADLQGDDLQTQIAAVTELAGIVEPEARRVLQDIVDDDATPADLRQQAEKSIAATDNKLKLFSGVEILFFGLSLGSVLVLAAIGLAITFGVMGVINMAHGELIMLGAYATYVMQVLMPDAIGFSLLLAIPVAFCFTALVGIAIERGVIRFMYGRPLETLLATFGISLILQQTVRSIFSPLNRTVVTPDWMSGSLEITAGLSLTYSRLYILLFSMLVFAGLLLLLNRSRLGLEIRAVAQNRKMAKAIGVRGDWVDAMTFGLGSGIAGVAGVALSQLTNVGPNMGQAYIIDSFLVVVFGGVGNLWGTALAGLSLGVLNKVLEPTTGAVLAKVLVLVLVILFIQRRPRGLFPPKGRVADH